MSASSNEASASMVWGPTIDAEICDGCDVCLEFCRQGVYAAGDGKVVVARREACMPGCSYCAGLCKQGAITFPSLEEYRRTKAETAG